MPEIVLVKSAAVSFRSAVSPSVALRADSFPQPAAKKQRKPRNISVHARGLLTFVRISRSILVNLTRIAEIRPKSHGDCLVILEDGTQLAASRSQRLNLLRLLNNQK
jgi:hypothetical protein